MTELNMILLQNVQRKNATKLLLSKENYKPTLQGWLTRVRNGHAKKCWCILIGKMFLYFKSPTENVINIKNVYFKNDNKFESKLNLLYYRIREDRLI